MSEQTIGPKVTTIRKCHSCIHMRGERYERQGDSGYVVSCTLANKEIGDSSWTTPAWCPLLGDEPLGRFTEVRELRLHDWVIFDGEPR